MNRIVSLRADAYSPAEIAAAREKAATPPKKGRPWWVIALVAGGIGGGLYLVVQVLSH